MSGSLSIFPCWSYSGRLPLCLSWKFPALVLLGLAFQSLGPSALPTLAAETPALVAEAPPDAEAPTRLLDQQPFDRVILDANSGNEAVDTLLLNLPNRQVPQPFPTEGSLELRRLSEPSTLYSVSWSSIARIDLFEQLLLGESVKLTESGDSTQAYEYLNFLHTNYPDLAGLKLATEKYLRQDALAAYGKKNYEEALTILLALHDLNPSHQGLRKFVEAVTDKLIDGQLRSRNFAAARSILDLLASGFPQLELTNVATWQGKFEIGAKRQLTLARQAIDQSSYLKARRAVRLALAILPTVAGAEEMLNEINRKSPLVVVGVDQLGGSSFSPSELDRTARRIAQLTEPKLIDLIGFGAEGGDYECKWADLASNDTGLKLDLSLKAAALQQGISAEVLALELLRQSDPTQPQFRADFAGLLNNVEIRQGELVTVHWRRSHVRPEALLQLALKNITHSADPPGAYRATFDNEDARSVTYQLPPTSHPANSAPPPGPKAIREQFYDNEEAAFADLLSGEVDVWAHVPPWQVDRLRQAKGVVVAPYRLPTIHVLLPNYAKPIMGRREFRRALCYGIDRPQIVNDILLGGENRAGYRVLSGPLPAGTSLTDPVGYAYNQGLQPRSYEPRLAAVLATVARRSVAAKAIAGQALVTSAAEQDKIADPSESSLATKPATAPTEPLILAHPPNPVATTVCQIIKLQLDAVGIPIKLKPLAPLASNASADDPLGWDLRYAELAVWEPIVDARRLLGPQGLAGNCSSSMSLALQDVDQAKNWKQVRSRLQEVHQTAFYDLPVIPLWQTVDFFAYRETLSGLGEQPVTLYQNVSDWQRVGLENGRGANR